MFDEIEMNVKKLLKAMLIRLGVVGFSFLMIYWVKPDIIGGVIILTVPLMLLQVWLDQKFVIKKQLLIAFWVSAFFIISMVAGLYGLIGLVFFYVLYFSWRLYKAKDDASFKFGVSMIKNCGKLGEDYMKGKR